MREFTVKCKWRGAAEERVVANLTFTLRGLQNAYATMRRERAEAWRTVGNTADLANLISWVECDGQRLDTRRLADVVNALDITEDAGNDEWEWALAELGIDQAPRPTLPDQETWDAAQAAFDAATKKESE